MEEAIEKASEIRFLPVVLTSLTAIGGLIPLALNPNPQISPLAWYSLVVLSAQPYYQEL